MALWAVLLGLILAGIFGLKGLPLPLLHASQAKRERKRMQVLGLLVRGKGRTSGI
jgi:hypothetical protein